MASENEIAGVYEDYLENESDMALVSSLSLALITKAVTEGKISPVSFLEDYERTQLISMIQNLDWTGEYNPGFEDERKNISTNDSCG